MGDRANIYVVGEEPDDTGRVRGIYLYSHWDGTALPERLRHALSTPYARDRWDDGAYLTRILVHELFERDRGCSTGSGIGTGRISGEHECVVLDLVNERVGFAPEGRERDPGSWHHMLSFRKYIDQFEAHFPDED